MPDVRRYLFVFWGLVLMLLKLFGHLSDGRAPLVEVLGPLLFCRIEVIGEILNIVFVPSLILFVKNDIPNQRKTP